MKTFLIFLSLLTISFFSIGNILTSPADSIGVKKINNQDYILYLVEQGETYTTIAAKYGLSESEIKKANPGIPNPNVNQVVLVPIIIKRLYTVQKGDYIYKVARDFKMDVKRLKELNTLESDVLKEGQQLIVEVPLHALQPQNNKPNQPVAAGTTGTVIAENQYNQPASEATIDYTQPASENATNPSNPDYNQVAGENPAVTNNNYNQPAGTLPAAGVVAIDSTLGENPASSTSAGWVTKEPKVHKVAQGEYIFALARQASVSVDSIKIWNTIESEENIHPGQDLIVGYNYYDANGKIVNTSGANIPDVKGNTMGSTAGVGVSANAANPAQMAGLTPDVNLELPTYKKETGYGKMIKDNTGQAPQQNVALHKSAPYGTYIKVVNPGNGKSVAVKIIGQIPQEMAADSNLLILISPTACNKIGVINDAFPIQLEYNQ
ncbi:LysM peptidoglycan-binding domain-containing protein [Flexithrix dorotheae]|uniref:LysM peptidoglycan-binding domain-containing protein n=1 Tax=Flexithrix dorotheae TaxID=70993 RepID=UPI00037EFEDA|nr:LysM peptidoglycan-binding domain-containing protein [Flexithrix dorotheae]